MRVLLTGASGFLGKALMRRIGKEAVGHDGYAYDFKHNQSAELAIDRSQAKIVVNAAARCGGIMANKTRPADFYMDNLVMGTNLMRAAIEQNVSKYVQIGTVCSYPWKIENLPAEEIDFWNGEPEPTNAAYGQAKRALIAQGQAYAKQYRFNVINPILANLYGPGDHYEENRAHVIPSLIKKFLDAKEKGSKRVTLWGSGTCTREFLYVDDAADAIDFLLKKYDSPEIINVATGFEVTIKEVAEMIAYYCKFYGDIVWDKSKPDGQPRRNFDISKMQKLGWVAKTNLERGIKQTIHSYLLSQKECAGAK